MTTLLSLFTLLGIAALVGTVCLFVHRIDAMLRSGERSVRTIAEDTNSIRIAGAGISPGIEQMNQNLYGVAVRLAQLGDAADCLKDSRRA